MREKPLKFNDVEVIKKKNHFSNQPVALNSVRMNKIVVSDKFERTEKGFKYFISDTEDDVIKPLCILLPQMSEYIKCFDNGGKICPLKLKMIMFW